MKSEYLLEKIRSLTYDIEAERRPTIRGHIESRLAHTFDELATWLQSGNPAPPCLGDYLLPHKGESRLWSAANPHRLRVTMATRGPNWTAWRWEFVTLDGNDTTFRKLLPAYPGRVS